jgi:hypothetical protein
MDVRSLPFATPHSFINTLKTGPCRGPVPQVRLDQPGARGEPAFISRCAISPVPRAAARSPTPSTDQPKS